MRFLATCRSLTSNNITLELTIIDNKVVINCLKKENKIKTILYNTTQRASATTQYYTTQLWQQQLNSTT